MDVPIRLAITLFSGFLQKLGSPGSGMVRLEHEAYQKCCGRPDVRVRLFPWSVDASDVAESLWRCRPDDAPQVHLVAGYSYGGDRAVKFVRQLALRGDVDVRGLWLCDGVRRLDWLWGVAAATGLGYLEVPALVGHCTYFVQRNPRWAIGREGGLFQPAGHPVVIAKNAETTLRGPIVKTVGHSYMDDDSQFRREFLSDLDRLLTEQVQ